MSRLYDIYVIIIGCIILRILISADLPYFISCGLLGMGMGIYSGLQK